MKPWAFVLVALCAYRLTRFFTVDTLPIVRRPREWIEKKLPEGHWLSELTVCPFCASVHITGATIAVWVFGGSVGQWLVTIAAAMGAVSLIFEFVPKDD